MADMLASPEDLAALLQRSDLDAYTAIMLIEMATALVQNVAGQRLVQVTDTAVIDILDLDIWLELPQKPINSVSAVVLDGVTITDWKLVRQKLWRLIGWLNSFYSPSQALVTYTHGYAPGSQYLQVARQMVLSLAAIGYGNPGQVSSEAIDDYKVTYADASARMQMTDFMETRIRSAYGSAAFVTLSDS